MYSHIKSMQKIERYIETLQSHSLETRKALLLGLSFGLTGLVVLLWIATFSLSKSASSTVTSKDTNTKSPFTLIKDNVIEIYASAAKGFDSIQK